MKAEAHSIPWPTYVRRVCRKFLRGWTREQTRCRVQGGQPGPDRPPPPRASPLLPPCTAPCSVRWCRGSSALARPARAALPARLRAFLRVRGEASPRNSAAAVLRCSRALGCAVLGPGGPGTWGRPLAAWICDLLGAWGGVASPGTGPGPSSVVANGALRGPQRRFGSASGRVSGAKGARVAAAWGTRVPGPSRPGGPCPGNPGARGCPGVRGVRGGESVALGRGEGGELGVGGDAVDGREERARLGAPSWRAVAVPVPHRAAPHRAEGGIYAAVPCVGPLRPPADSN